MALENYTPPPAPRARKMLVPSDVWRDVVALAQAFRNMRVRGGRLVIAGRSAVLEIGDVLDAETVDAQPQPSIAQQPVDNYHDQTSLDTSGGGSSGATTQPVTISGMIEAPTAKTYMLDLAVARATSLKSFSAQCTAGTCTVKVGGYELAVTSSALASHTFATPVNLSIGDSLPLIVTVVSGATDLAFAIEVEETL